VAQCPFELNLIPKSSQQARDFSRKQPWIFASAAVLAASFGIFGVLLMQVTKETLSAVENIQSNVTPLQDKDRELSSAISDISTLTNKIAQLHEIRSRQAILPEVLSEVRQILLETEQQIGGPSNSMGIWVHQMNFGNLAKSVDPNIESSEDGDSEDTASEKSSVPQMSPEMMKIYGLGPGGYDPYGGLSIGGPAASSGSSDEEAVEEEEEEEGDGIRKITLLCTALNRKRLDATANTRLAQTVLQNIKASPLFTDRTTLASSIPDPKEEDRTFDFDLIVYLAKPL
jgi:hypothetical protein